MKTVLLTGFEPFGDYKHNPTQDLVNYISNKKPRISQSFIYGIVLPCTYKGAFEILSKEIDRIKPDAIISTGLSSSVGGVRIETVFRNMMYSKYADADGFTPNSLKIREDWPMVKQIHPNSDSHFLAELLSKINIPVELSQNANTFICNSLGFLTSAKIQQEKLPIKNMFIHIPWTSNYQGKIDLDPDKVFIELPQAYDAIWELADCIFDTK